MKGFAATLSFPFRIYATGPLPELDKTDRTQGIRIRVCSPFRIREKGTPLSPDVPIERWPRFKWSPKAGADLRLKPPKEVAPKPFSGPFFDAMRFDVWGPEAESNSIQLPKLFLRWLRVLSLQPWIGSFESQTDPILKNTFEIDRLGRATVSPWAYGKVVTPSRYMRPIDGSLWKDAFDRTLGGSPPPTYWQLFLDSHNERASAKTPETVLALALSLEVARDTLFPTVSFEGTDLLRHLSVQLEEHHSRDLSVEERVVFSSISRLYIARHHVAHGKPAIVRTAGAVRAVLDSDLHTWSDATFDALAWLEQVSHSA